MNIINKQTEQKLIIRSMLDFDHYKLTMGQFVFKSYADVPVKYAFKNRTRNTRLAEVVDENELRYQLDGVRNLRTTDDEINYLSGLKNNRKPLFGKEYLAFLKGLQLPNYNLKREDGNFKLEFEGPWAKAIYWETFALSILNELYYRKLTSKLGESVIQEGKRRLEEKLEMLEQNPDVKFLEFGTRRRFSRDWQEYVVDRMKEKIPGQMTGTSNVYLAMKYNLAPKGTMAHELFMIMSGIMHKNDDEIRASHNQVLTEWWNEYGADLSIALTDTYGSDFFFKDMTAEQAKNWKGMRQDSGSPDAFANKQIEFYRARGIDPQQKLFVPSDGLETKTVIDLQRKFGGKIKTIAGWGTNLTNDMDLPTLSMVIKAVEANGYGTVKLSDNPAKTMGAPEDVERFMRIFDYDPTKYQKQECKY